MQITVVGIDLAKNVFQLHGVDNQGTVVVRKKLTRPKLLPFVAQLAPCRLGMEACQGAHYWARAMRKLGHDVRLVSPQFVTPYRKSQKNDPNDAAAICEAVSRPHMRFVPIKEVEHQDIQALHRARQLLIKQRTALCNQIRGLLSEYGIVVAQGVHRLRKSLPALLENVDNGLTLASRELFQELYQQLVWLDERIEVMESKILQVFTTTETCQRLADIEGIGPIIATALYAAVPQARVFKNGRHLAAWVGLVPRQHSTGGKSVLLGISKRGDRYLRALLIHGARAVVYRWKDQPNPWARAQWLQQLIARRGINCATVALANKMARVAWVLLSKGVRYQPMSCRGKGKLRNSLMRGTA
jgi:transposase